MAKCSVGDSLGCTIGCPDSVPAHPVSAPVVLPLQVIAERMSEEEITGLKATFEMMDTDHSGTITFEELKAGLERAGSVVKESEVRELMDAVSCVILAFTCCVDFAGPVI